MAEIDNYKHNEHWETWMDWDRSIDQEIDKCIWSDWKIRDENTVIAMYEETEKGRLLQ